MTHHWHLIREYTSGNYHEKDLIVSFMLAAPQPENHHRCGFTVFYKGEFYGVYQLPEIPVFVDLIVILHSLIFSETFSDVERILVRPRHLVWCVKNPPYKSYKIEWHKDRRYKYLNAIKERFYQELKKRNIAFEHVFMGTELYYIHEIGFNLVKMRLGKFYGKPIDNALLHQKNLKFLDKLNRKGIKVNYGESVLKDRLNISIN